ncbi:MAG: 5'-nucleotidase [uncultured Sphingomonadaceae bacterium]|uniref:5'-nucleotidase n=1 Tax=uncultured Sphingomonadaceae bacterium TaxID=169976 RepID=A0A6J4RUM9_9SPHN|nr:MAG: 5'-nucleotidase [uncultured Sphingomonadaceae bacterium]
MRKLLLAAAALLPLAACATPGERGGGTAAPVTVRLIGLNDFHGNLEPPGVSVDHPAPGEGAARVPAGGAAHLASAVRALRAQGPHSLVLSAGDMIGASPLVSALFLDEPTIAAMNLVGVDYNAVGNHEFDRGRAELLRMQRGGCGKNTTREPCAVEPFAGARFPFLSANVWKEDGTPLFAPYAIRSFGRGAARVKVAIVGATVKETPTLVTPAGVAGLRFGDEAEAVNALVPELKAKGADAIVVLIHQGARTSGGYSDANCPGLEGDILPILDRLDPAVDAVVSGHTHRAYVCDYARTGAAKPLLLTSAGRYGTLVTDIALEIDPAAGQVVAKRARNLIVQGEGFAAAPNTDAVPRFPAEPGVAALVARYAAAARPVAARPVGRLSAPAARTNNEAGESVLGNLVADAQLAATRGAGAQVALMNPGGLRADIAPDPRGDVSFGQLFAAQPFANLLVVKTLTGRQLRALLEQQFASGTNSAEQPNVLSPSANLSFAYDLTRPAGARIAALTIDRRPVRDEERYRVAVNSFLSGGGDNFTVLREGADPVGGAVDVDALEAYFRARPVVTPPALGRVRRVDSPASR